MRFPFFMLLLFMTSLVWPEPPSSVPVPEQPAPQLIEHALWDQIPPEAEQTVLWSIAGSCGVAGVGFAAWGLGTALGNLSAPGGPPLAGTISGLAWSTLSLAIAGVALDVLLSDS